MKRNIGTLDRMIRAFMGLAFVGVALLAESGWWPVGLVPLVTAAVSYCPPYALFGIDTTRPRRSSSGRAQRTPATPRTERLSKTGARTRGQCA